MVNHDGSAGSISLQPSLKCSCDFLPSLPPSLCFFPWGGHLIQIFLVRRELSHLRLMLLSAWFSLDVTSTQQHDREVCLGTHVSGPRVYVQLPSHVTWHAWINIMPCMTKSCLDPDQAETWPPSLCFAVRARQKPMAWALQRNKIATWGWKH